MTPQEARYERRSNGNVRAVSDMKLTSTKYSVHIFCPRCIWQHNGVESSASAQHVIVSHERSPRHAFWTDLEALPFATWDEVNKLSAWALAVQ